MSIFNPAQLDFNGEEVRAVNELIFHETNSDREINTIHDIKTGVVAKEQIGIVGQLGLLGVAGEGCGDITADTNNAPVTQKFWEPKEVQFRFKECYRDWEASFFAYTQKMGYSRPDLTGTQALEYMQRLAMDSMKDAIWRLAWYGDTNSANVSDSPAGTITDGVGVEYFTILNGFWNQLFAIGAADATRRVTIAKNAEATYSAQELAADTAIDTFRQLLENADPRLKRSQSKVIVCTQSLFENYLTTLESKNVDPSFEHIEGGFDIVRRRNVPIIPIHYFDTIHESYYDNGASYYLPHRAVLMEADNLPIAFEEQNSFTEFDIFYDKRDKYVYMDGLFKMDTKVIVDHRVQVAY